jgi:hypothetical protein
MPLYILARDLGNSVLVELNLCPPWSSSKHHHPANPFGHEVLQEFCDTILMLSILSKLPGDVRSSRRREFEEPR